MDSAPDPIINFLANISAFKGFSSELCEELASHAIPIELHTGQTLFIPSQRDKNAVFVIKSGEINLQRPKEQDFILKPEGFLALNHYFDPSPFSSTATALSDVEVIALPTKKLRELDRLYPELNNALHHLLIERMREQAARRQPVTGAWSLPARTIMKSPLITCNYQVTVREAFVTMLEHRIGSLGVVDDAEKLLGIMTLATLTQGLIVKGAQPDDPIQDDVCEQPYLIDSDTPLWKVQNVQSTHRAKYLVVTENNIPAGIVSQTDILHTLLAYQRSVIAQIGDAISFEELKSTGDRMGQMAQELRQSNRSASMAVRALSEIHLALQHRCIDLVLDEMDQEGRGQPPVGFAFIIMGSGGRKEMLIKTDQDNGIILADTPYTDTPETKTWFEDFCNRVNQRLDEIGYEWCPGDIMARNPAFHKSLSQWKRYISRIAEVPNEKAARWGSIFFDFETLYGDDHLTTTLRNHILKELKDKPRLLRAMVEDDAEGRPPLGLFNRLLTTNDKSSKGKKGKKGKKSKGKIDLKRNGTRILADAARIYALSAGIDATNTGDRLQALVRREYMDTAFVESILEAYDELLDILLDHQLEQLEKKEALDKMIEPNRLTELEVDYLRMSLRVIKHLQAHMQSEFGVSML